LFVLHLILLLQPHLFLFEWDNHSIFVFEHISLFFTALESGWRIECRFVILSVHDVAINVFFLFSCSETAFTFDVEALVSSSWHVKTFLPWLLYICKLLPNLLLNLIQIHLGSFANRRPSIPQINRPFLPVFRFKFLILQSLSIYLINL